jgi:hypothetical protein
MAKTASLRMSAARWGAVAALVVAALGVGTLVASAYEHATPPPPSGEAAPVPTFDLGVQTPTPTPTPEPVAPLPRDSERFLAAAPGGWWRGLAGACSAAAPVVERSTDGGLTWTDVTPLYTGAAQLAALGAVGQSEAELIVGVGAGCVPEVLRTYTQGEFWEPFPDVLAASHHVSLTDPAVIQRPAGPVAAPCADARGLRADGDLVALVCDATAHISAADGEWVALPAPSAAAVAVAGTDVLVAHTTEQCFGIALTRYPGADPSQPGPAGCAEGLDPSQPLAIAPTDAGTLIWSADTLTLIP